MAKRRTQFSEKKIEEKIRKGRGSGEGRKYKPWLTIHDFPSEGKASRILGIKSGRVHQFLSSLELNLFYILEWSDSVIDIREQYPLLERSETIVIAEKLGIKHPTDPKSRIPIVMTTDFLVTSVSKGQKILSAISVKPSKELDRKRIRDKFEIEKCYWKTHGIDLKIATEKDMPAQFVSNLKWLYRFRRPEDLGYENKSLQLHELSSTLISALFSGKGSVRNILRTLDKECSEENGTFLKIFKHLLSTKRIIIDLNNKIDLNMDAKDLAFNFNKINTQELSA